MTEGGGILRIGEGWLAGEEPSETWCRPTVSGRDRQARRIFAQGAHRKKPRQGSAGAKVARHSFEELAA